MVDEKGVNHEMDKKEKSGGTRISARKYARP